MTAGGRFLRRSAHHRRRRRLAGALIRTAAPLLPSVGPPDAPIFIVGSPRSGTTALYEILKRSSRVGSLDGESHILWEMFHPRSGGDWRSDEIAPDAISDRERRCLYWSVDRLAPGRRYLDKAPANSLRIPYLDALFPDARFVFVKRDGRAAVSSLITGWQSPGTLFPERQMPVATSIDGFGGTGWKFLAPPGWERYASGHALAEVCAFQWVASIEAILRAEARVAAERWTEIAYEDLVRDPGSQVTRLLSALDLPAEGEVLGRAAEMDLHLSKAVSAPEMEKWRRDHPREIETILSQIGPTMQRLGYAPTGA